MFSKGRTATLFSAGIDLLAGWLNKNAARPEKKNQAIATAATDKPEPTTHRMVCFLGFAFGDLAATGWRADFNSSAVNPNPEPIALLTFVSACCKWAGV